MKKPQEAQKSKALWKMKAAKDAGEEYHDPNARDKISTLGRTLQRSYWCTGQSPEVCGKSVLKVSAHSTSGKGFLK